MSSAVKWEGGLGWIWNFLHPTQQGRVVFALAIGRGADATGKGRVKGSAGRVGLVFFFFWTDQSGSNIFVTSALIFAATVVAVSLSK
jgi:hypothetical protein